MWERQAQFCPLCGGRLERRGIEGRQRPRCNSCTFVLYENPAPAAAAVVLRGREVLLVRRSIEPFKDHWTLPAGYEEVDESPAQTAIRETREETGLEVRVDGLYDVLHTDDDPRKVGILVVYLCSVEGGELCPGDGESEVRFFSVDALPEPVGFKNDVVILRRLRRELAQGTLRSAPVI